MAQVRGDCRYSACPLQPVRPGADMPDAARLRLADAYAAQSASDFALYNGLLREAEECHRLHDLQMACEKIAKAYRLRDTESFQTDDLDSHVVFSRFILGLLKSAQIKERYRTAESKRRQNERYARTLSAEIERLAPAVDREQNPANAEYPWMQGETVFIPSRHQYPVFQRLLEPSGRDFLKLIEIAIEDYHSITLNG